MGNPILKKQAIKKTSKQEFDFFQANKKGENIVPVYLNGLFWTVHELARYQNVSVCTLHSRLENYDGIMKVGQTRLIPDDIAQEIISGVESSLHYMRAARHLGCSGPTLLTLMRMGLPHDKIKEKMPAIHREDMNVIRKIITDVKGDDLTLTKKKFQEVVDKARKKIAEYRPSVLTEETDPDLGVVYKARRYEDKAPNIQDAYAKCPKMALNGEKLPCCHVYSWQKCKQKGKVK